jgi:rhamnosyltransferase
MILVKHEQLELKIAAIIVAYNPELLVFQKLLLATAHQVYKIFVVDNSTSDKLPDWLKDNAFQNVGYFSVGRNIGVGAAQNIGIREALQIGATHVLLLDHDSIPDLNMVSVLITAEQELIQEGQNLAAVGPRYKLHGTELLSFFVQFGLFRFKKIYCANEDREKYVPADFLISSGCLISLEAISEIGLLDESLFIDHVDTEWFLRAKSKGYSSFGICAAVMNHNLGDYLFNFWFFRKRTLPIHSPLRHYYIFRNSLLLYKRPYASKKWIINDAIRLGLMLVTFSIFIPPRANFFRMMIKGLYDGFKGRSGRYII